MPGHSTQFEVTDGSMALTNAILLYRPTGQSAPGRSLPAFASLHAVEQADGKPTIGVGAPLSHAHLRQWAKALGLGAAPEILPDNVVVYHTDMLAWWTPERVRLAYFNLSAPPKGLRALSERTVMPVPYPAHLFVATRSGLGVYALPTNERPTAATVLMCSPVLNVFDSGQLCWGNIPQPKKITLAAIPEYERAVFDSWSTHPNPGQEHSVTGKGGLVRLWDDLATRKAVRFPYKQLKPFTANGPVSFGQLVARSGRA